MKTFITTISLILICLFSFSQEKVNLRKLHRQAKKGYTYANYELGRIYDEGILVERDTDKALKYYEFAAEKNYSKSVDWILNYYSKRNRDTKMLFLWTRKASEFGDSVATFDLSKMFEYGIGCKVNLYKRHFYCKEAAEQGYVIAQKDLAEMYFSGFIVDTSFAKGVQWLDSAANNGDKDSQFLLAEMYYRGEDVIQDISKAIEFYSLAAEKEDPIAQVCLLHHYSGKSGYKENIKQYNYWHQRFLSNPNFNNSIHIEDNIKEYTKLAYEKDYTAALLPYWTYFKNELDNKKIIDQVLGKMLNQTEKGLGSIYFKLAIADYCFAHIEEYTNEKLILKYCKDAVNANIPESKILLSEMYKSKYARKSFKNLTTYYDEAIEYGQTWAADSLVILYAKDPGAKTSYKYFTEYKHLCSPQTYYFMSKKHKEGLYKFDSIEAFNYCQYAYKNGISEAGVLLAIYYYEGKLIDKDCKKAFDILNKSEFKESPKADYYLGLIYLNGCDIDKNIDKAYELIKNSADNGFPTAQFHYAELINNGKISNLSKEDSFAYYEKAAIGGINDALIYVGKSYYYGKIVKKDDEKAYKYLIKSKSDKTGEVSYISAKLICEMSPDNPNKEMYHAYINCNWACYLGYPGAKQLYKKYNLDEVKGLLETSACCD